MQTRERQPFTNAQRRKILAFYGERCIVTGTRPTETDPLDLDHITDSPEYGNSVAEAAPVLRSLNRSRGGVKAGILANRSADSLPACFSPDKLASRANLWVGLWQESAAYACARL